MDDVADVVVDDDDEDDDDDAALIVVVSVRCGCGGNDDDAIFGNVAAICDDVVDETNM